MIITNAEQTNYAAAANQEARPPRSFAITKVFWRGTFVFCRISGLGDGCVFS